MISKPVHLSKQECTEIIDLYIYSSAKPVAACLSSGAIARVRIDYVNNLISSVAANLNVWQASHYY